MPSRNSEGIVRIGSTEDGDVSSSHISPMDRGFTLGDSVFDTLRVYSGVPFRLQQHLQRMQRSASHFGIHWPGNTESTIAQVLLEGVGRGLHIGDCSLRTTLSRGIAKAPGLLPASDSVPTLVVSLQRLVLAAQGTSAGGLRVVVAQSRLNERSASAGHKTPGSADAIYELGRARGLGADDCLFLDTMGHVAKGSASNVFVYDGEALITPPLSCGVLPGVTRGVIIEVAQRLGVPVAEKAFGYDELLLAREIFLTSSLREIVPVQQVDSWQLYGQGGVTKALSEAFKGVVAAESATDGPCTSEQ